MQAGRKPERSDVAAAAARLRPHLEPTPLVESAALGAFLKLETAQPTGSYKVRGGLAALSALEPRTRVVAASAGNHGLGIAYAAERLGVDSTVVVAETASPAKVAALRELAVTLVVHGRDYDEAAAHGHEIARREGRRYLSPDADADVIAGQGTVALELLEQAGPPLTIVCPVGGGGLCGGVALWASAIPGVEVVGVVAAASPAMTAALAAGRIVPVAVEPTLADGLAGNITPGAVSFELVRDHAAAVVEVSEDEIAGAMRFLAREHELIVEGAGAAAAAALLAGKIELRGTAVALVTGRNVAQDVIASVLAG